MPILEPVEIGARDPARSSARCASDSTIDASVSSWASDAQRQRIATGRSVEKDRLRARTMVRYATWAPCGQELVGIGRQVALDRGGRDAQRVEERAITASE